MNLYGPLYVAAGAAGAAAWWRRLRARGIPGGTALLGIGIAAWAGAAGAFGLHALVASIPGALPAVLQVSARGGSTVLGAILGGTAATVAWARFTGLPAASWLDAAAGAAPLAQAIGRLGCLSAGCCFGRPTGSWLALPLPDVAGTVVMRYPTQLMAAAGDLGILVAVLGLERRLARTGRGAPGLLFATYLGLYGAKRFLLECFRGTAAPLLAGLTWAQLAAAALGTAGAAAALVILARRP